MPTPTVVLGIALAVIAVQRVGELALARRNEAWARERGAEEVGAGHYPVFFVLHIGWLVAWPIETTWGSGGGGPRLGSLWGAWVGVFLVAQALRYWAIRSLGRRWNTRILVLPGAPRVDAGPYRWLPHPNYIAVGLELVSVPMCFAAHGTAIVVSLLNAALLLGVRIPAENAALRRAENAAGAPP